MKENRNKLEKKKKRKPNIEKGMSETENEKKRFLGGGNWFLKEMISTTYEKEWESIYQIDETRIHECHYALWKVGCENQCFF